MIIYLTSIFRFLLPKQVAAIALWPFIIFRIKDETAPTIINHERIHLRQQIELLVIPFYVIYITEYLWLLMKLRNHNKAYLSISFEKEAYENDSNKNYLKSRKLWGMWR